MTVIALPDALCTSSFRWKMIRNQIVSRSPFGSQALEASTPQWVCNMTGVPEYVREAKILETFLEQLAGVANQVAVYNRAYPVPEGTMRGSMTLYQDAFDGDLSFVVDGGPSQAGATLLKGDLLGIGGVSSQQVHRLSADTLANPSGLIFVPLVAPLRGNFPAGTEVRWDRPAALFRQRQDNEGIEYQPGVIGQPWSLDLIEDWRP